LIKDLVSLQFNFMNRLSAGTQALYEKEPDSVKATAELVCA
jgi:hypothetical protein